MLLRQIAKRKRARILLDNLIYPEDCLIVARWSLLNAATFVYPRAAQREDRRRKSWGGGSPLLGFSSKQGGQENLIARDSRFEVAPPMFSAISTRYHYGIATLSAISFLWIRLPGQLATPSDLAFSFSPPHRRWIQINTLPGGPGQFSQFGFYFENCDTYIDLEQTVKGF